MNPRSWIFALSIATLLILGALEPCYAVPRHFAAQLYEPAKTRQVAGDPSRVVSDLISLELDTDNIETARLIAQESGLEIVSKEGTLSYWYIARIQNTTGLQKRDVENLMASNVGNNPHVLFWQHVTKPNLKRMMIPTDPAFRYQWNLRAVYGSDDQVGVLPKTDIGMVNAWDFGYSGQGVHVQFIDDGLYTTLNEFTGRVDLSASWSYETNQPSPSAAGESFHGTSCAGITLGAMNNSNCGTGIAYGATVSAIRYIGVDTLATTATVLTNHSDTIDISSNSWGYGFDIGGFASEPQATIEALATLADQNVTTIFAAGNDHLTLGSCSRSEIIASPFTIVVGAVNDRGVKSAYSAECPNLFISAPSSDASFSEESHMGIVAPGQFNACSRSFGGTSAATPTVSGVVALLKEARPELTARDISHILAYSADVIDSTDVSWLLNAAGFYHSDKYGFGKVNATRAILVAKDWKPLAPESYTNPSTTGPFSASPGSSIPDNTGASVSSSITVNIGTGSRVEHVGAYIRITHTAPNQLDIRLTSPSGTVSQLSQPFYTMPMFTVTGTSLVGFASPYWSSTRLPNSVTISSYYAVYFSCDLSDVPSTTALNRGLLFASDTVDGCTNYPTLIEEARTKGYSFIAFYTNYYHLDWATTSKSTLPSFWLPISQETVLDALTFATAFRYNSAGFRTSTTLSTYQYFGTFKSFNEPANGVWRLTVRDVVSGTIGTLNAWTLQLQYTNETLPNVPKPVPIPPEVLPPLTRPAPSPGSTNGGTTPFSGVASPPNANTSPEPLGTSTPPSRSSTSSPDPLSASNSIQPIISMILFFLGCVFLGFSR